MAEVRPDQSRSDLCTAGFGFVLFARPHSFQARSVQPTVGHTQLPEVDLRHDFVDQAACLQHTGFVGQVDRTELEHFVPTLVATVAE